MLKPSATSEIPNLNRWEVGILVFEFADEQNNIMMLILLVPILTDIQPVYLVDAAVARRVPALFHSGDKSIGMSLLRGESLRVAAQGVGVEALSAACVAALLPEVELRVREVVQDALKFQKHAKRAQLSAADVNRALQTRNLEALYGFQAAGAARYRQSEDQAALYFPEDDELEVAEVLNAPLGQIPMHPVLNLHWLAVDGVQPMIPENESAEDDSSCHTSIRDEAFVSNVDRKPLVKHVLTEEMQLYYAKVTDAVKSDDAALQRAAFASLARDPGIHQLLPYLSRFIYEEVRGLLRSGVARFRARNSLRRERTIHRRSSTATATWRCSTRSCACAAACSRTRTCASSST